jgi:hypothetical protein
MNKRFIGFVNPDLFGGAIELLRRYNVALNYAINKIPSLDLRSIGRGSQRSIQRTRKIVWPPIQDRY